MGKHLIIAGHGRRKNGTYDTGAFSSYMGMGEHEYMKKVLFPAMKKYADDSFVFFDAYNVYSHGDLIALARKYKATDVTEIHFDGFNGKASGGHVIIHRDYKPDNVDLKLVNVIKSMVGSRFNFRGISGLSGRGDLANVNIARNSNITYRMLELGFGDNPKDARVLYSKVDEYAKKLVQAIGGSVNTKPSKPAKEPNGLTFNQVVEGVMGGYFGNMPDRKRIVNNETPYDYDKVQAEVNRRLGSSSPKPKISFEQVVRNTIRGTYGNMPGRKTKIERLGHDYQAVQREVNRRL